MTNGNDGDATMLSGTTKKDVHNLAGDDHG